jgi:ribosome biogenesis GTPase
MRGDHADSARGDDRPLADWGWDARWAAHVEASADPHLAAATPARVTGQERDRWSVVHPGGAAQARLASAADHVMHPVTGDWVLVEPGPFPSDPLSIVHVLPRRSAMTRGAAGTSGTAQVLAANIDVIWIVHGLDAPPNLRRLERFLTAAWDSGAMPEIVLTKADLAADPAAAPPFAPAAPTHCSDHRGPASRR